MARRGGVLLGNAPPGSPLAQLATIIDDVRPDTVLTFGPDGMTGHLDHIAASRWTVSGYFLTRLIRRAACAFGLARPCSQFSRVRTFVRR